MSLLSPSRQRQSLQTELGKGKGEDFKRSLFSEGRTTETKSSVGDAGTAQAAAGEVSSERRPPQRGGLPSATVPSGCGVSSGPGLSPHPDTPALEEGWGPQGWLRWRKETAGGVRSEAPS